MVITFSLHVVELLSILPLIKEATNMKVTTNECTYKENFPMICMIMR